MVAQIQREITEFEQAVAYLEAVPKFTKKHSLKDTKAFLEQLGNPECSMKIIHVAGTNGKGSVCAYLQSVLQTAGYRTCMFTSPHLTDMRERFLVNGQMICREQFMQAFQEIYRHIDYEKAIAGEGYHPTFFEYLFCMAMLIFQKANPDYVIVETGLGGRMDTTNAVAQPLVSVITKIGLDHTEYLGSTIAAIAGEKAGIIKPGIPVVYNDSVPEASEVIRTYAAKMGSPAYPVSKCDYALQNFRHKKIDFSYHSRYYDYIGLTLSTVALYQMENAAVALRALEVMDEGRILQKEHFTEGIRKALWEGRMEEVLPEVYLDGAHNEDGIRAFLNSVQADGCTGSRHLMLSVVKDKSYRIMISLLMQSGLFRDVVITSLNSARTLSLQELKESMAPYDNIPTVYYENSEEAFGAAREKQEQEDKIYIVGSLYLVGEIKAILGRNR